MVAKANPSHARDSLYKESYLQATVVARAKNYNSSSCVTLSPRVLETIKQTRKEWETLCGAGGTSKSDFPPLPTPAPVTKTKISRQNKTEDVSNVTNTSGGGATFSTKEQAQTVRKRQEDASRKNIIAAKLQKMKDAFRPAPKKKAFRPAPKKKGFEKQEKSVSWRSPISQLVLPSSEPTTTSQNSSGTWQNTVGCSDPETSAGESYERDGNFVDYKIIYRTTILKIFSMASKRFPDDAAKVTTLLLQNLGAPRLVTLLQDQAALVHKMFNAFQIVKANKSIGRDLTAQVLAACPEFLQKQLLGECLYPLVHQRIPRSAGKITGSIKLSKRFLVDIVILLKDVDF